MKTAVQYLSIFALGVACASAPNLARRGSPPDEGRVISINDDAINFSRAAAYRRIVSGYDGEIGYMVRLSRPADPGTARDRYDSFMSDLCQEIHAALLQYLGDCSDEELKSLVKDQWQVATRDRFVMQRLSNWWKMTAPQILERVARRHAR